MYVCVQMLCHASGLKQLNVSRALHQPHRPVFISQSLDSDDDHGRSLLLCHQQVFSICISFPVRSKVIFCKDT